MGVGFANAIAAVCLSALLSGPYGDGLLMMMLFFLYVELGGLAYYLVCLFRRQNRDPES